MKHVWSILCRRAITDQSTQAVSLFEVIDGFPVPENAGEGLLAIEADFVTVWEREDERIGEHHNARLTVLDPRGDAIGTPLIYNVDLESAPRARNTTRFPGFPIRGLGSHNIRLETENPDGESWDTKLEYRVRVISLTAMAQALVQEGG
jgi:hypothetical protein